MGQKINDDLSKRTWFGNVPFADLAGRGLDEDQRIEEIARKLTEMPDAKIGVMVELTDPKKGNRYIEKLKQRLPGVIVMNRTVVVPGANGVENISFVFPSPKPGG